jgi:6-phosphogluconolactonase
MKKLYFLLGLLPGVLAAQPKPPKMLDLLIGTYTSNGSDGIYVYRFYTESGRLAYLNRTSGVDNPSYLCVSTNRKFVYSVNEIGDDRKGGVSAFSFEPKVGKIELINKQVSGAGPCYISIDKGQKNVFTANYAGGNLYVFPVNKDGSLSPASQIIQEPNQGLGPNKQRQDKPHVHTAILSPDEKHLLFSNLGSDKVNIYRYKASQPQPLSPSTPAAFSLPGGEGPRHIDFSPDKKYMYVITEIGGADIHVSPDGRFLYASNRGDANEIVVYAVNQETGLLTFVERQSSMGNHPRNFVIDPSGKYLLVANQKSNNIVVFKINPNNGHLTNSGIQVQLDSPSCLKFMPAE